MAVLAPRLASAVGAHGTTQLLRAADGRTRAVQGEGPPVSKPHAATAERGKGKPETASKPNVLRFQKARSAVFDVRTLKGDVVKRERPERAAPGEGGAAAETAEASASAPTEAPNAAAADGVAAVSAAAPLPDANFEGLDFANWGAGHPPDTNGDVGPTYYIQTINTSIGIYRKSDGVRVAAFTFNAFMSQGQFGNLCDTDNFGDPVVLYDSFEDRWFITDFAFKLDASGNVNPQHAFQCVAVSKTGDPVAGGWNFYSLEAPGGLGDYPKFGVWSDGIYMSANMFGYAASASFIAPHVWAINKQQMYAGEPTAQVLDFAAPSADFTLLPGNARLQAGTPPAGRPEFFVSSWQFLNALLVYKFKVDWDRVSTSTFTGPEIQLAPSCWPNASVPNAATPGNSLDTLQIRAMAQAQYSNLGGAESLWVSHTVRRGESATNTTCNATTTGNATVRWYQANVTGGTVAANVVQGKSWDPDGANTFFRFMPSLAVDHVGDMAIGYSKSNSTTFPQIKYAGRLASDPLNTFSQTEQTLIDGTGTQTGNCGTSACTRWGDYSGMSLDPDGCTFWETNEYYAVTGLDHHTRIGSFRFPGCTTVGNGTLSGTVTDGANPLAGVTLMLGSRTTTTNGSGAYSFTVPAGTYPSLTARKPGYGPASAADVAVPDGGTATRNFTLGAGAQSGCFTDDSQSAFQTGVPTNCDLVASPGSVVLANPDNTDTKNSAVSPTGFGFTNTSWAGQTFTPTVTGKLKRVDVELFCASCSGANPDVTLSIRATTGTTPVPTGADLATATLTGFNDNAAGGLKTFTFASPITVTAGTRYAFVFRANATRTGTYAYTCSCATTGFSNTNPYANGQRVTSTNSGSTWTADTTVGGRDLSFVTYINPGYASSGTFVSSLKDANPTPGRTATWTTLSFSAATPAGTDVKFQVAGSNTSYGPFNYVGPDGTAGTYFTTSGASLSEFNGFRYLRYKAYLSTSDGAVTPALSSVQVCFEDVAAPTDLAVDPAAGTFGGTTTLSAKLTSAGNPLSGKTISFTLNGNPVGTAQTGAGGVATLNNASLAGIDAGNYPAGVGAAFAGDAVYGTATGSAALHVDRANQTIAVTTHAPATAPFGSTFTVAANAPGGAVAYSSSGACTNVGDTFTITSGTGTCSVFYDQAGGTNYFPAQQVTESVTAQKAVLTVKPSPFTASRQYSDPNPTFTPDIGGFVPPDDASSLTTAPTCSSAATSTSAPGNYPITCSGGADDDYSFSYTDGTLTVTQEDARATYNGNSLFWTSSASSANAAVTLSATIRDATALPVLDPAYDIWAGDIRNAKVTFVNRDTNTAFAGCSNLPVGLVVSSDTKTGTATCTTTLTASNATGATQYRVGIVVSGYYTRNDAADDELIDVAQPLTSNFITGGGNLVLAASSGQVAGAAGTKMNFGFNVKYNKPGTNLQGGATILVRSDGRIYQIKSSAISSLGVVGSKASFTGKASIQDVTDSLNVVAIDGNATLQLWLTDNGEPGTKDTLGVQVLSKSGGTWFSSNWNGTKTVEQNLAGGNLSVH
jgi:hypothetical protein